MTHEIIIRDCGGKEIGRLESSEVGWRAFANPGSTSEEIDYVMDKAEPIFTRMMEARKNFRGQTVQMRQHLAVASRR